MIDLSTYKYRKYSESYQDGILECIFNKIGITNKYFIELGSNGTDTGCGNSIFLREVMGFSGLLIDAGEYENKKYDLKKEFITAENINDLLVKYHTPEKFDFLSIDIDGEDYHVMNAIDINRFYPRVVTIEFNTAIFPHSSIVQLHNPNWIWNGSHFYGCSLSAITKLMNIKNYSLVCVSGSDAIFINNNDARSFDRINDIDYFYKIGANKPAEDMNEINSMLLSMQLFVEV
jgi:hypothetical protein